MNKPTRQSTAPTSPPSTKTGDASCKRQVDVLQSLKVLQPGY